MSLVWNDEIWFFDKRNRRLKNANFKVVRKLFVSNIPLELSSLDILTRKFRKYGEIEKIEVHKDKYFVCSDNAHYEYYAYVTFKESDSTHKVLKDKSTQRRRLPFKIQPADTWQQPPFADDESDDVDYLTQLPSDCLYEILDYLDLSDLVELAVTCRKFHGILHQRTFCKIQKFEFNFNRLENVSSMRPIPLGKMRKYLLAVGKYLKEVTLIFHFDQDELPKHLDRIIDIFTHFMRENSNLETLNLHGLIFTSRIHLQFQQIFGKLKRLRYYGYPHEIDGYIIFDPYDVDFATYCTNLKTLKINQHITFEKNSVHWNKLENITIGYPEFSTTGFSDQFFQNNSGLKRLKLDGFRINSYLEDIIRYLPNLEKLTIFDILTSIEPHQAAFLPQLKHLKKIHFQDLWLRDLNPLLKVFADMPTLECIKISMEDDSEPVMNLTSLRHVAMQLTNLKEFHLKHYTVSEDMVIDVIQCSSSLAVCSFLDCKVPLNVKFLERIINVRKEHDSAKNTRLKLIMDTSIDMKMIDLLQSEDVLNLLHVIL